MKSLIIDGYQTDTIKTAKIFAPRSFVLSKICVNKNECYFLFFRLKISIAAMIMIAAITMQVNMIGTKAPVLFVEDSSGFTPSVSGDCVAGASVVIVGSSVGVGSAVGSGVTKASSPFI